LAYIGAHRSLPHGFEWIGHKAFGGLRGHLCLADWQFHYGTNHLSSSGPANQQDIMATCCNTSARDTNKD
jgi:hypothetical protein